MAMSVKRLGAERLSVQEEGLRKFYFPILRSMGETLDNNRYLQGNNFKENIVLIVS